MEERQILKIEDKNGKIVEYDILMAFKWSKTDKYYVIYTDNIFDSDINVYASIYDPNDSTRLYDIETEEEWEEIERKLEELQGVDNDV